MSVLWAETSIPLIGEEPLPEIKVSSPVIWYAIRSKPRHERVVRNHLAGKGLQVFLPEHSVMSRRLDRRKMITVPLFPGYLFAGVTPGDNEGLRHVRWTPGVSRILGMNGEPTPVPGHDVESLRLLIAGGRNLEPVPFVSPGDRVRVKDGPFEGAEGTVVRLGKNHCLVISVFLLQRSVAVELDGYQVEKIAA